MFCSFNVRIYDYLLGDLKANVLMMISGSNLIFPQSYQLFVNYP